MILIFHNWKNHLEWQIIWQYQITNISGNLSYILSIPTTVLVSFVFGFDKDFSGFHGKMQMRNSFTVMLRLNDPLL